MPGGAEAAVRTTCPYCGVGCGLVARRDLAGGLAIEGDPDHPANCGRICSKGAALAETLSTEDRLLHPEVAGRRVGWDAALDAVTAALAGTIERHGPEAVAFYLSGQLLTEDYYVANKFAKGFLGTANVDTNSRLCMASSVAGHVRAFGSDTVPQCYEDLDLADLIVLVGSNAAWCHPVLHRRMLANRAARGARIVVIDPRRTATVADADLHLPLAAGSDVALFNGLLVWLADSGKIDEAYVAAHCEGYAEALAAARASVPGLGRVAALTGLDRDDLRRFYTLFAGINRVVTCYSQGVNQSAQGSDKVNAILNCHLASGRIGRPGSGPLSLTGQPNAMGGREVGGLANQLAAHMDFTPANVDRVGRFWGAAKTARQPGLKAVAMFEAVERGEIKFLWILATNPAVSLPRANAMRNALQKLETLVVSENVRSNDTISAAHIRLPAAAWGEKDGTVTNSERRISRQRPFLPLPGEARPDWWAVAQVAGRMGFAEAFSYAGPAEIFREHAALSGFENGASRDFDIGGLADLDDSEFDALTPVQWPVRAGERRGRGRFFGAGGYFSASGRAQLVPVGTARRASPDRRFTLILNTGRQRDQWHSMTRTGKSETLGQHSVEPCLEIHPADAAAFRLIEGGLARAVSAQGEAVLRVRVSTDQQPGAVFAPIHWSDENASKGRVGALVHAVTDPVSGQPDCKGTRVAVEPVPVGFDGFLLSRSALALPPVLYWARTRMGQGYGYSVALEPSAGKDWSRWFADLLAVEPEDLIELKDRRGEAYRAALMIDGRLEACGFFSASAALPSWNWLKRLLLSPRLDPLSRRTLLAGRALEESADPGPVVCACFSVCLDTIRRAIERDGLATTEEIGAALKAGTNCGSCLPELRRIADGAVAARAG